MKNRRGKTQDAWSLRNAPEPSLNLSCNLPIHSHSRIVARDKVESASGIDVQQSPS